MYVKLLIFDFLSVFKFNFLIFGYFNFFFLEFYLVRDNNIKFRLYFITILLLWGKLVLCRFLYIDLFYKK